MFRDRIDAGHQLATQLIGRVFKHPLVLGIPRGGVPIGAALASRIGADLDVVLARKIRHPDYPEYAVGAIGEDEEIVWNDDALQASNLTPADFEAEIRHQRQEIARRRTLFREGRTAASPTGRSVILVDDGLATGATALAALHVVCSQHPHELLMAIPVGSPDRLPAVQAACDECICLLAPGEFRAVGNYYEDFSEVDDAQVVQLLRAFDARRKSPGSG